MHNESHPGIRSRLTSIWHLPDRISWMSPLPPAHRRGIILALLVMLVAFLWPEPSPHDTAPRPTNTVGSKEVPLQAEIYNNSPAAPQPATPQKMRIAGKVIKLPLVRRWRSCFAIIIWR